MVSFKFALTVVNIVASVLAHTFKTAKIYPLALNSRQANLFLCLPLRAQEFCYL